MYNVDDAIAKIDGYVISIAGGGPFVGREEADPDRRGEADGRLREHRERQRRARDAAPRAQASAGPEGRGTRAGGALRRPSRSPSRATDDAPRSEGEQATIERLHGQTPPWPPRRPAAFAREGRAQRLQASIQREMAYAIIEMGGKQYRVEKGDSILVDRMSRGRGRQGRASRRCCTPTATRRCSTARTSARSRSRPS